MPQAGTTLPSCPTFSAPASPSLQHVPPWNTEGPSHLAASGHWEQEGDSGAADDKNSSCGISSSLFPRRKEKHQGNTQRSTVYPHFQSWAGPWEAEYPRETLRAGCRVLSASYLSTGSKKKSKASTATLGRVRSRQIADFKS